MAEMHSAQAPWDEASQNFRNDTHARLLWQETHDYMTGTVLVDASYQTVRSQCKNKLADCTWYAATRGECFHNFHWMRVNCAPACRVCDWLDIKKRCPVNRTTPGLFAPGDLHRMYERIVQDFAIYQPKIHSKPSGDPQDQTVLDGPWILTLESFLTPGEANNLIDVAQRRGLKPSIGRVVKNTDGTYERLQAEYRTSSSAYCHDECYVDDVSRQFNRKIESVTGTPHSHSTFLHFLRYEESQFYRRHSDYVRSHHREQQHGVRVLTILVYLSDVEAGGGTHFPLLNLTVTPKRGRALIFPNVLNAKPTSEERRTLHEALPVEAGEKFAVSMYVHQKDYKQPFYEHCIR